jgi:Na+:H+ antiporter
VVVALLCMAMLAQVFGSEGIVGAFFAGLALNRLVPNEGPSMDRVELFGSAVFIPIFVVSIGLLLDPSVMFKGETLGLAALICVAALGGKAVACWLAGSLPGFSRTERAAMFVLTAPQGAATLAVTLIGFEIGLFGTSVVNAVLVLILVSIVVSALLAERVIHWVPARLAHRAPLGARLWSSVPPLSLRTRRFASPPSSLAPTAVIPNFSSRDPRPSRLPTALSYADSRRAARATASTVTSASTSTLSGTR